MQHPLHRHCTDMPPKLIPFFIQCIPQIETFRFNIALLSISLPLIYMDAPLTTARERAEKKTRATFAKMKNIIDSFPTIISKWWATVYSFTVIAFVTHSFTQTHTHTNNHSV